MRAAASGGKCVVAMQPRLCAAISTGPGCARMVFAIDATQALRAGVIQSSWRTRTAPGSRLAHRLCQWPAPESRQPGTMMMRKLLAMDCSLKCTDELHCAKRIQNIKIIYRC